MATKDNLFVRMDECIEQLHVGRDNNLKCLHYSGVLRQPHSVLRQHHNVLRQPHNGLRHWSDL